jgi:hypothetical protein
LFAALLVMPQAHDPRNYEDKSHYNTNDLAQPLGHWLFVWPGSANESSVKHVGIEPEYDDHDSHDYLKYPRCHRCYLVEPQPRALPTVAYPPTPPPMLPLPASPYAPKFVRCLASVADTVCMLSILDGMDKTIRVQVIAMLATQVKGSGRVRPLHTHPRSLPI